MKILIAPDSFKGSLTAHEAARAIEHGVLRACPSAVCVLMPVADGGEGTAEAMLSCGGRSVIRRVKGPLGSAVEASFTMMPGGLAVVEMAAASGLILVPESERDVMRADTYGTGELILAALDEGASSMVIGIGGSATVDGGVGMLSALGVKFKDAKGHDVLGGGEVLMDIASISMEGMDKRLEHFDVTIACDVDNPLTGPNGAAAVFGPQKGATPGQVKALDNGLANLANVMREFLGVDIESSPGSGAAGGLGGALMAFLGAKMRPGIDVVLDAVGFEQAARGAALVITGEGKLDGQSLHGKAPVGIASRAKKIGVPVIALAGSAGAEAHKAFSHGIASFESAVNSPMDVAFAMDNAWRLLADAAERAMRFIMLGIDMNRGGINV